MKIILVLLSVIISSTAFAGDSGAGSLISSFVNVGILAGGLIYLLKGKASTFFSSKSSEITEMINRAASKAKEADEMMKIQKEKVSGLEGEIQALKTDQEKFISDFESGYMTEIQERISHLDEDAGNKIEAEKTEMLEELNANLLDLVIANAKTQIKADPTLTTNAAKNMIKGL
jgi:F0F1-type ATP synthase membrane subunit b/b'